MANRAMTMTTTTTTAIQAFRFMPHTLRAGPRSSSAGPEPALLTHMRKFELTIDS